MRRTRTVEAGVALIESMVDQYRKEHDEDIAGEFDEGSAAVDLLPSLQLEGWTAQDARAVAVALVGFVPRELADAYGMRPSEGE